MVFFNFVYGAGSIEIHIFPFSRPRVASCLLFQHLAILRIFSLASGKQLAIAGNMLFSTGLIIFAATGNQVF